MKNNKYLKLSDIFVIFYFKSMIHVTQDYKHYITVVKSFFASKFISK